MKLNRDELQKHINTLPYSELQSMVRSYGYNRSIDVSEDLTSLTSIDLQRRLEKLGVNQECPECGSEHIVKNGKRNHIQRYKCKACNTQFTPFTNTIMEKTKWDWSIWVEVMRLTLNNVSLAEMKHVLATDFGCIGIDQKTVLLWRHKIISALAKIPQPKLSGIVQVDETFVREAQKGSKKLVSYIGKDEVREPRYGRKPSKYGVMGAEFATITTAIDNTGHCVCKVTGLGRLTPEVFTDMFEDHFNAPAYVCTDANPVYHKYCEVMKLAHYERPSNYLTELKDNGYVEPTRVDKVKAEKQRKDNDKIRRKLYKKGLIDRLTHDALIDYDTFKEIREMNNLNLARVNELHADIKLFINKKMTNVSTKYLADYIGYFTYVKNWKVDNGRYPLSRKDAKDILIEILKNQGTYTITDMKNTTLDLPKPSSRYTTLLKKHTKEARRATKNEHFKFDEEDHVISFDKRNYLLDIPEARLKRACKHFGIKFKSRTNGGRWATVSSILKHPKVSDIFIYVINEDKVMKMYYEDIEYLEKRKYRDPSTA